MELNIPKSKEELLNSTNTLPYDHKVKLATKLGAKHAQELKPVVKALRQVRSNPQKKKNIYNSIFELNLSFHYFQAKE